MRGRSYSPPLPRGHGRRGRSPSPRGRYGGRSRDAPTSLLVRNLRHDCRPEDLRRPFGQYGPLKDIYLPRDYYTGEPRGFGFVQYVDPADAADAKYHMDGQVLLGRQLTVVFAEENRKKPMDMRARERGRGRVHDRRRSPPRYSRSPPPRYGRSRSRSRDYYSPSPNRGQMSRSASVEEKGYAQERSYARQSRERSFSRSPSHEEKGYSQKRSNLQHNRERSFSRSVSPGGRGPISVEEAGYDREKYNVRPSRERPLSRSISPEDKRYAHEKSYTHHSRERSYSGSPARKHSPYNDSRSRSRSPGREHSPSKRSKLDMQSKPK